MKRTATATVLGIILVGAIASIAAINAGSSSVVPDLKGKTVIIGRPGFTPTQEVSLGVIGDRQFLVTAREGDDGVTYDLWTPLDSVSSLLVFENMEDAVTYGGRYSRTRRRSMEVEQQSEDDAK